MKKISLILVMAVIFSSFSLVYADETSMSIAPPANIVLTNDSEYDAPDNLRFRLRYQFDKDETLTSLISMSEAERAERYGEEYKKIEAQIQIDWSFNSDNDWKYNDKWDVIQGKNNENVWEYYKTDVALNKNTTESRNVLYLYNESLPEWSEKPTGMSEHFEGYTFTKTNNVGKIVDYIDLERYSFVVRSRFIVKLYSDEEENVPKYIMSEWSETVGIGKGFEPANPDKDDEKEENPEIVYDAYGELPIQIANSSAWAKNEVNAANNLNLIPNVFKKLPLDKNATRAEFAALAVKLYEKLTNRVASYIGVTAYNDCSDADVLKARKLGIVKGVSETMFLPQNPITREEAAVILYRTLTYANKTYKQATATIFKDAYALSDWAVEAVNKMSAAGYIQGSNNLFSPKANISREEAIAISYRIYNK